MIWAANREAAAFQGTPATDDSTMQPHDSDTIYLSYIAVVHSYAMRYGG